MVFSQGATILQIPLNSRKSKSRSRTRRSRSQSQNNNEDLYFILFIISCCIIVGFVWYSQEELSQSVKTKPQVILVSQQPQIQQPQIQQPPKQISPPQKKSPPSPVTIIQENESSFFMFKLLFVLLLLGVIVAGGCYYHKEKNETADFDKIKAEVNDQNADEISVNSQVFQDYAEKFICFYNDDYKNNNKQDISKLSLMLDFNEYLKNPPEEEVCQNENEPEEEKKGESTVSLLWSYISWNKKKCQQQNNAEETKVKEVDQKIKKLFKPDSVTEKQFDKIIEIVKKNNNIEVKFNS